MKSALIATLFLLPITLSAQWNEQDCDFTNIGIGRISIANENCVWATGRNSNNEHVLEFTRTVDGGDNWVQGIIDPCITCSWVGSFWAVNCDRAFAVIYDPNNGGGAVLGTSDGGLAWDTVPDLDFSSPTDFPNWIGFFNQKDGICMGDPQVPNGDFRIFLTSDGGAVWSGLNSLFLPDLLEGETGYADYFAIYDQTIWFITNKSRLFRSANKGTNWEVFDLPRDPTRIVFKNKSQGLGLLSGDQRDSLLITNDGGATWDIVPKPEGQQFFDLSYAPAIDGGLGSYVATGEDGIYSSWNNGESWELITPFGEVLWPIAFLNEEVGWAGGEMDFAPGDGIFAYNGGILGQEDLQNSSPPNWTVYPNPGKGIFQIRNKEFHAYPLHLSLINSLGQTLENIEVKAANQSFQIGPWPPGLYFLTNSALGIKERLFLLTD